MNFGAVRIRTAEPSNQDRSPLSAFLIGNGSVESVEKGFLFFEGELVIDTDLCLNVLRRLAVAAIQ